MAGAAVVVAALGASGTANAAQGPVTKGSVSHSWTVNGGRTRVDTLTVKRISPANAKVTVLCHGGGCPFSSRSVKPRRGRASLAGLFRGHRLRAGANIAVVVVAPGTTGRYVSFDMRPRAVPKLKAGCAAPGSTSPVGCPGPVGPPGPAGQQGAAGPSDAYVTTASQVTLSASANTPATVASLDGLPAGSYVFWFSAEASDFNNPAEIASCFLRVNGQVVASAAAVIGNGAGSARTSVLTASTGATLAGSFKATLECQTNVNFPSSPPATVQSQRLTAIRVGSLHTQ